MKIGYCGDESPRRRIAELQTGNPHLIQEMFSVEGTLRQERALHASLKVALERIRLGAPSNEWYPGRHPFIRNIIAQLGTGGANAAIAFAERYNPAVKQPGKERQRKGTSRGCPPNKTTRGSQSLPLPRSGHRFMGGDLLGW